MICFLPLSFGLVFIGMRASSYFVIWGLEFATAEIAAMRIAIEYNSHIAFPPFWQDSAQIAMREFPTAPIILCLSRRGIPHLF